MTLLRNILRRLGRPGGDDAADGADRRGAPRVRYTAPVVLTRWTGPAPRPPTSVLLRDFSTTGLGVIHTQPLDPAEQYALRLPGGTAGGAANRAAEGISDGTSGDPPDGAAAVAVCRVVRCWSDGRGRFAAGLEFVSPVPPRLLWQAVRFPPAGPPSPTAPRTS